MYDCDYGFFFKFAKFWLVFKFPSQKSYQKIIGLQPNLSDSETKKVSAAWFKWLSTFPENILGAEKFLEDVEIFLICQFRLILRGKFPDIWPKKSYVD